MNMNIKQNLITDATYETIYWWNRSENYYHQSFAKLDFIHEDKDLLKFFINKIFETFLREYAVRRNISKGNENIDFFIDELFTFNFIENVKNGDINIIDKVSEEIQKGSFSNGRHTKSLLSKIAFLINPHKFYLYDTLAKQSICKQNANIKLASLENYSYFWDQADFLRKNMNNFFNNSNDILNEFQNTIAHKFFSANKTAFERRIIDKFLWLSQKHNKGRELKNEQYSNFIKLINLEAQEIIV